MLATKARNGWGLRRVQHKEEKGKQSLNGEGDMVAMPTVGQSTWHIHPVLLNSLHIREQKL